MQDEGLQMVPRKDRPSPEDLLEYESDYPEGDPDYEDVRPQLAAFLYDYRRKQEEERDRKADEDGREPYDDVLVDGARMGFDPQALTALQPRMTRQPSGSRR